MEKAAPSSPHRPALAALGLAEPQVARLAAYLDTLAVWSVRVNLTGARSPEERVRLLVGDVLPALPLVRPGRLIDVGSGNGSPGLVLAVLREDVQATLLEPRQKRWAFLREAARVSGLRSAEILRARHDAYHGPAAATVTVRALALPLDALAPVVEPGGRLILFGVSPIGSPSFVEEAGGPVSPHVFRRTTDVSRET